MSSVDASPDRGGIDGLRARLDRRVVRFGVPLSPEDLATIDRFHRRFIEAGLALRFESYGRPPQSGYPSYRDLLIETDAQGRQRNYLASEESFQFLKSLHARDLIVPVVGTVLTLSHWPGSPTPVEVRDDLSAQIALHALDHPGWFDDVDAVSNNHFDQDGLAGCFALVDPAGARAHADLLVDLAAAGDFATFRTREGARLAMAVAAFADESRSPLEPAVFAGSYAEQCGALYLTMLELLPGLLDDVDGCRALWADEDAHLDASIAALADGTVTIEEVPSVDLAVVTIPEGLDAAPLAHRFAHIVGRDWTEIVHPMAINNATSMLRILLVHGRRYRLELRYETWVMLTSRRVMPRLGSAPDRRAPDRAGHRGVDRRRPRRTDPVPATRRRRRERTRSGDVAQHARRRCSPPRRRRGTRSTTL